VVDAREVVGDLAEAGEEETVQGTQSAPANLPVSPTDICASEEPPPADVTNTVEPLVVTAHESVEAPAVVVTVSVLPFMPVTFAKSAAGFHPFSLLHTTRMSSGLYWDKNIAAS